MNDEARAEPLRTDAPRDEPHGTSAPGATPAIDVRGLRYAYGDRVAVDGIDFTVAPGEVLGFLGPNGAGKSTTIKVITGQLIPSGGEVHVLGMDVVKRRAEVQARIGVCFEEKNLYTALSGEENLRFFARLFGIRNPDVDGLLKRVGLHERGRDRVANYSKGMRQRLMMARALINDPDVLVLDEPSDGLDPSSARTIRDLIRERAEAGTAVLLTTHDMWEADELAHRVAFLHQGRFYAEGAPEDLKLRHGKRAVRVRTRRDGRVHEETVPLDEEGASQRLARAMDVGELLTVHTEEATLESVFVQMTGTGLQ